MTLLIISFIAGVLTILAPCILPLLPVIVGRSIADSTPSRRRMITVILSLGISVFLFTLLLKLSTLFIDIPQDFWKYISGGIIFIFGIVTLFPSLWENLSFTSAMNQRSNQALMVGYNKNNVWGDIIVGASLGPIFSACSPTYFVILATVLPVRPVVGIVYLLTYVLGLCLALLVVSILGQKITQKLNIASNPRGWFKKTLGVIFILVSIGILTGYDKKLQVSLLDAGFFDVTKIEQGLLDSRLQENNLKEQIDSNDTSMSDGNKVAEKSGEQFLTLEQKKKKYPLAPDLSTIDGYINTGGKPITISEFKGKKVVLLDIWTYSCINCQRTLPYLNDWYKKYEDKGLVIIGLHTPEFSFERVLENVQKAVKDFGVQYPVVLDNDFSTWNDYHNQYWPRKYLIDIDGYIVYDHAGEGQYAETEMQIQKALRERADRFAGDQVVPEDISNPDNKVDVSSGQVGSPEIYFGSARNSYLSNGKALTQGTQNLIAPFYKNLNNLYLEGTWFFVPEYAENTSTGNIFFRYSAKNVYMVASSLEGIDVEIFLDGEKVSTLSIKDEKLYPLIQGTDYGEHTLLIKVKKAGLKAFTFTFG